MSGRHVGAGEVAPRLEVPAPANAPLCALNGRALGLPRLDPPGELGRPRAAKGLQHAPRFARAPAVLGEPRLRVALPVRVVRDLLREPGRLDEEGPRRLVRAPVRLAKEVPPLAGERREAALDPVAPSNERGRDEPQRVKREPHRLLASLEEHLDRAGHVREQRRMRLKGNPKHVLLETVARAPRRERPDRRRDVLVAALRDGLAHPRPARGRRSDPRIATALVREQQLAMGDAPEDEECLRGDVREGVLLVEPVDPVPGGLRTPPVAERLDDGPRCLRQPVHEAHRGRGPGMAHEVAHRLGTVSVRDRLGERAERAPVAVEGVGRADPVALDEPALVVNPEPAMEEGLEADIDTRAGRTPVGLVKKTDGRAPERGHKSGALTLEPGLQVLGERDAVGEGVEGGQQMDGGGLHVPLLNGGA